jgi:adenosine deaminase
MMRQMKEREGISAETFIGEPAEILENLRKIPKADLHAHSAISCPFSVFQRFSSTVAPPPNKFHHLYDFLEYFRRELLPLFEQEEVVRETTRGCFDHMVADGITYAEVSFDIFLGNSVPWSKVAIIIEEEIARVSGTLQVSPELGVAREAPDPLWRRLADEALSSGLFEGVDIYGVELARPIEYFLPFLESVRRNARRVKIHSGEIGDPERIRHEVQTVNPYAVQHGVRSGEDTSVMELLAKRKIQVNVCPTSNIKLSVTDSYKTHPIRRMFDAGVRVTINSDDYAIFQSSVSEEFLSLYQAGVFNPAELEQIRQNSF